MPRVTIKSLEARIHDLSRDSALYQEAFRLLQTGAPVEREETVPDTLDPDSRGVTHYRLYATNRAHGGLVIRAWSYPGQTSYHYLCWLDELQAGPASDPYHARAIRSLHYYRANKEVKP